MSETQPLSYKQLSAFFIPLGVSASLTSVTHVIINGTLSRGENAVFIIACYAVAISLFAILEVPLFVFRQTSSALVTDERSFQLLRRFFNYTLTIIISIGLVIAFTPVDEWIFTTIFNATPEMVDAISITFKVMIPIMIFSGVRGLYQGIIINQLATNWLTIGVVTRLFAMFFVSYILVLFDQISSVSGAIIFLVGMIVECIVSVYKGKRIIKREFKEKDPYYLLNDDIKKFYFPLMFYAIIQSLLIPLVYALLAKSNDIEIGIASFALAMSITQMILGFFAYTHQLVLQFYARDKQKVVKFTIIISIIPTLILSIICFTPIGLTFMRVIMGANETLSIATISVLKFFILKTLIFPWVDFLNGFLMLKRQTKKMLTAQIGNITVAIIILSLLMWKFPTLNGVNGSIAASLGELAGFIIISTIIFLTSDYYQEKKLRVKKPMI